MYLYAVISKNKGDSMKLYLVLKKTHIELKLNEVSICALLNLDFQHFAGAVNPMSHSELKVGRGEEGCSCWEARGGLV